MIFVVLINLAAIGVAAVLPNDFLMWHSYVLYGFQFATMVPFLLKRAVFLERLFMPTIFVLAYYLVNLSFGSYLVPRGYGWEKQFTATALAIRDYNLIVPFLMGANLLLFVLSAATLRKLATVPVEPAVRIRETFSASVLGWLRGAIYLCAFVAVSIFEVYSAFTFQLVIAILHLTDPHLRGKWFRFGWYAVYLLVLAAFSFENKREIAMVLFLVVFLETYYSRTRLRFAPSSVLLYCTIGASFFALVLAASILRGYGNFEVSGVLEALWYIPGYLTSDLFIDGITDNLELNYNYGVTVTSIDHGIRSLIDYQYGATLLKVFYLPVPRDALAYKPESMMAIFTQVYAPEWWSVEGSMPVMFAADMFLNFHVLGLVPFALVWMAINKLFVVFHTAKPRSFITCSCLFLFITVLMFARGSGIEHWLLYYLIGAPVFLVVRLLSNSLKEPLVARRWVV
jgi:hypothetical protein